METAQKPRIPLLLWQRLSLSTLFLSPLIIVVSLSHAQELPSAPRSLVETSLSNWNANYGAHVQGVSWPDEGVIKLGEQRKQIIAEMSDPKNAWFPAGDVMHPAEITAVRLADADAQATEVTAWQKNVADKVKFEVDAEIEGYGGSSGVGKDTCTECCPVPKKPAPKTEPPPTPSQPSQPRSETPPVGAQPSTSSEQAQLVGFVYDKDSRQGDQVIASLTTDPKKYENIPGLGMIEMRVPTTRDAQGQATLQGLVVDLGDGRPQPANQPLTLKIGQGATAIPVTISQQGGAASVAQGQMPILPVISPVVLPNTGKASDFTTPPVVQNVTVVHGPLSGDANVTHVTVDNQPATVVAGTPRSVFFSLPANTTPGAHTLTLQDGGRTASAPIVKMGIVMQAGQLNLLRGQSTTYTATVLLGPLPDSVWQHGGSSSDLLNPEEIASLAPNFKVPQAGQPATVLFRIDNASRDTITIKPSQNESITRVLHQQDFQNGQFSQTGTIQSKKSGGFVINGTAMAFFAPINCSEAALTAQPGIPPVQFVPPPGGAVLATAKAKGKGGDGLKESVERTFRDTDLKICENTNCGDPQENKEGKNKGKGLIYCKDNITCGGTKCPKASCHMFWTWIDGAKGPGGKDHKEDNEKWSLYGSNPNGIGEKNGIGKDNAIPNEANHAYACVCE